MPLVRVFYVSRRAPTVSELHVQVILGAAQIRNRRLDVTGMLARSDGHFVQVLEGRREAVDDIMARISRDARHRDLRILIDEPITRRRFERWAMGMNRRDDLAQELQDLHDNAATMDVDAVRAVMNRLFPEHR